MTAWLSVDGSILHIQIPMQLRRRGGEEGDYRGRWGDAGAGFGAQCD